MATSDKLSFPGEAFGDIGDSPGTHTTDSFGSHYSGKSFPTSVSPARPRMDIICVIDFQNHVCLSDRKKAFEEIKNTSSSWEPVTVHHIQVSSINASAVGTNFKVVHSDNSKVVVLLHYKNASACAALLCSAGPKKW